MSELTLPQGHSLKNILEAALLAADQPLTQAQLASLFEEDERPSNSDIAKALEALAQDCVDRGVELKEVASGFRMQVKKDLHDWVSRLWTERPQKYSRAMLETLSLIAYRQPITRGEIESVRGVSLSSNIIRSLQEREWIRIVGHRDVPGKPALFGTTKMFLDYFDLKALDELPTLSEIKDMESLEPELEFDPEEEARAAGVDSDAGDGDAQAAEENGDGNEDGDESDGADVEADPDDWDEDGGLGDAFDAIDQAWDGELQDTVNIDKEEQMQEANDGGLFEDKDAATEEGLDDTQATASADDLADDMNDDLDEDDNSER